MGVLQLGGHVFISNPGAEPMDWTKNKSRGIFTKRTRAIQNFQAIFRSSGLHINTFRCFVLPRTKPFSMASLSCFFPSCLPQTASLISLFQHLAQGSLAPRRVVHGILLCIQTERTGRPTILKRKNSNRQNTPE